MDSATGPGRVDHFEHLDHLERLVAEWGMVADFAFADLLLFRPLDDGRWIVSAQIRPTTARTLYPDDLVGRAVTGAERPQLDDVRRSGLITDGNVFALGQDSAARVVFVPVSHREEVVAVMTREVALDTSRRPGRLERTYLEITDRLAAMVAEGTFPFASDERDTSTETPRVGDGAILLDADGTVVYASPNAVSALHRLGANANAEGVALASLGIDDGVVARAFARRRPELAEIEPGPPRRQAVGLGVSQLAGVPPPGPAVAAGPVPAPVRPVILATCIPLLEHGSVTGAVLLVRDVTELRRRDRMLLSKDATIREVHHRVKNNLQTVSALLRLQGRRLASPEAKQAIEESVRRVRSIALVHETLSREIRETVPFDDVVRPLVRLVEEGLQTSERPVRFVVEGELGDLPPETATPLAVVLVELLQNAVEHAYPAAPAATGTDATVRVQMTSTDRELRIVVRDQGPGFPPGFTLSSSGSLGLTIVRTLVTTELGGLIAVRNDGGAVVELRIPRAAT
jgi:two-component sensor histidine kinase